MQCTFWRMQVGVLAATFVVVLEQPVTMARTFLVECHGLESFAPHLMKVLEKLLLDISYLSNGIGFGSFAQAFPARLL
eukprot:2143458-Pleurochrysis_carterae.AAC.1